MACDKASQKRKDAEHSGSSGRLSPRAEPSQRSPPEGASDYLLGCGVWRVRRWPQSRMRAAQHRRTNGHLSSRLGAPDRPQR